MYTRIKIVVRTILVMCLLPFAATAQSDPLDKLFAQLADPALSNWEGVEDEIWHEWSMSGSPAVDLLLQRGRDAMAAGDLDGAIEHLSALIDHAPDFAEAYNARATAYYEAGLYGPSMRDIESTLALNPRHFGAMTGLALILEDLGFQTEALRVYRSVSAIHPHRPNVKEAIERLQSELDGAEL